MTKNEVLTELQARSNPSTLAHNKKYGATNTFGVKLGDIRALAKKIKVDPALSLELWQTGNADAQMLSCLIAKPSELTPDELIRRAEMTDFAHVADWFNNYLLKDHPQREDIRKLGLKSDNKWGLRSAWSLTAGVIARGASGLNLDEVLNELEATMPKADPEVQWTMNTALANIGIYHLPWRQRAIDIGEKLGIYRDFPVSKGCTSPFAPIWINAMAKRQDG